MLTGWEHPPREQERCVRDRQISLLSVPNPLVIAASGLRFVARKEEFVLAGQRIIFTSMGRPIGRLHEYPGAKGTDLRLRKLGLATRRDEGPRPIAQAA